MGNAVTTFPINPYSCSTAVYYITTSLQRVIQTVANGLRHDTHLQTIYIRSLRPKNVKEKKKRNLDLTDFSRISSVQETLITQQPCQASKP